MHLTKNSDTIYLVRGFIQMIEKASYWRILEDDAYVVQITMFFCKKTLKETKEEMHEWKLTATGYSKERELLVYKKNIDTTSEWEKEKANFSFSAILKKVKG